MMRRYSDEEERRVRVQQQVRDWMNAGLITATQAAAIDVRLRTDLKRTNELLRAGLALFTVFVVAAVIGFIFVTTGIRDDTPASIVFAIAAVACFVTADYLAGRVRLYAHGIEEALAMLSAILAALALFIASDSFARQSAWRPAGALAVGAAAAFLVYRRFGLMYAAIGAMACAGLTPLPFNLSPAVARTISAALFGVMFAIARVARRRHGDEFPGDEYALLQAAACAGVYLALNQQVSGIAGVATLTRAAHDAFYWATYVAIWSVPAVALTIAIRDKDRPLLDVGLLLALATLASNKPYLGLPRQTWDPILLGVLMAGGAIGVKRWLAAGAGGIRTGYTADRITSRDRELLTVVGNLSVAVPAAAHPTAQPSQPSPFAGGRSGGGGGGGDF